MILDKKSFKQLEKDGGGTLRSLNTMAVYLSGYEEIKSNLSLNMYILSNGVFADIALGKKIYFSYDSIKDVTAINKDLKFKVFENDAEKEVTFRVVGIVPIEKYYNKIRENANLEFKEVEKVSITEQIKNSVEENKQVKGVNQLSKRQLEKQRIKELKEDHIPFCPKCHSTSLQYVENRKKLSLGRAVVGGALIGPAGAVLGGLTSKKYKGKVKCLNCGHEWKL